MIVGITVHDNDFGATLQAFCERISDGTLLLDPKYYKFDDNDPESGKHASRAMHMNMLTRKALSHTGREITQEEKDAVLECIKESWAWYVSKKDAADYLIKGLDVTFPKQISDQWRNGEQFYVFFTSYSDHKVLNF